MMEIPLTKIPLILTIVLLIPLLCVAALFSSLLTLVSQAEWLTPTTKKEPMASNIDSYCK